MYRVNSNGVGTGAEARRPPADRVDLPELDLPYDLVVDLVMRRCFLDHTTSISRLTGALALPAQVIESVFQDLRARKFLDVEGLLGQDYVFCLTAAGREQARERFERSRYASVAPVPLAAYHERVLAQRAQPRIDHDDVRRAFADLVLPDRLVNQIGAAFTAQESMFIYGPSGTGKTAIAERLGRLHRDGVLIPRAVEVDGQIVTVFDPTMHRELEPQPDGLDPRWVACHRPVVTVGGELDLDMLQLRHDPASGTYLAPLQMRANNGILFIDDFGRQLVSPQALLNRWIVPLDRRVDHLALQHGQKFVIPFEPLVVFSTNLDPADLNEDAFFRRIQAKIYVGPISEEVFDWIVSRSVQRHGLSTTKSDIVHLRAVCRHHGGGRLLGCYPEDFCRLAAAICRFAHRPSLLNQETIDEVSALYFATADADGPPLNG